MTVGIPEQPLGPSALPGRVQPPASQGQDLERSFVQARAAVRYVDAVGCPAADVALTAQTALVCTGDTPADALQAAADLARGMPRMQITSLAWAKTPGHADGIWQWQVTLTVTAWDPATGEYSADVHHAGPAPSEGNRLP